MRTGERIRIAFDFPLDRTGDVCTDGRLGDMRDRECDQIRMCRSAGGAHINVLMGVKVSRGAVVLRPVVLVDDRIRMRPRLPVLPRMDCVREHRRSEVEHEERESQGH